MNSPSNPQAKRHLGQILIDQGILTEDQLRIALLEQTKQHVPVGRLLVQLGFVSEATLRDALSEKLGLRSEEHTSELQSRRDLVCRLLLEKKNEIYSGTSGPHPLKGLVRPYYLRRQPTQADLPVNLLYRHEPALRSHDVARCFRPALTQLG